MTEERQWRITFESLDGSDVHSHVVSESQMDDPQYGGKWKISMDAIKQASMVVIEPVDDGTDTLAQWLYQRYIKQVDEHYDPVEDSWENLTDDYVSYWEHEAKAVRRAVARGGFKRPKEEPSTKFEWNEGDVEWKTPPKT